MICNELPVRAMHVTCKVLQGRWMTLTDVQPRHFVKKTPHESAMRGQQPKQKQQVIGHLVPESAPVVSVKLLNQRDLSRGSENRLVEQTELTVITEIGAK